MNTSRNKLGANDDFSILRGLCFLAASVCFLLVASESVANGQLPARLHRQGPLTFAEFKAAPEQDSFLHAKTTSHLKYDYRYRTLTRNGVTTVTLSKITFRAEFLREKSWTKRPRDLALLRHEQGHFDITEVLQRKATAEWRSQIGKLSVRSRTLDAGKKEFDKLVRREMEPYFDRLFRLQKQYDAETDHGRHGERQQQWQDLLAKLLKDPSGALPLAPEPAVAPGLTPSP